MKYLNSVTAVLVVLILWGYSLNGESRGATAGIEEKDNYWRILKGASHGVKKDMNGHLMKRILSSQSKKYVPQGIATFKVFRVFNSYSYARVDSWVEGFSAKDAQFARFDKKLSPPVTGKKTAGPKPKPEAKIAAGKTQRWYMDKADSALKQDKYGLALSYYNKVLEIDPDDPGARLLAKTTRARNNLQQGELYYGKKEFALAYEYYIVAFQNLGKDNYLAARKVLDVWGQEAGFYEKMKEFEVNPAVLMQSLFEYCGRLREENKLDELAALAQKMIKYAERPDEKNKLETFMDARVIEGDVQAGQFNKVMSDIELAIEGNNFYKASYMIDKLENASMDEAARERLDELKGKLRSQKARLAIQKDKQNRIKKIKDLEEIAEGYRANKEYGKAIESYMEIYEMDPGKEEYGKKIEALQEEQFKHEQSLKRFKAVAESNRFILQARGNYNKELLQDALDDYVKAYKALPEEGKAVAGIVKILETCGPNDSEFITKELLGRKLSKFIKDFLSYVEKTYLDSKDDTGLGILNKIKFIEKNKAFDELVLKFKANLYEKNMALGHGRFKAAAFDEAAGFYGKAETFKDTPEAGTWLTVCAEMGKIGKHLKMGRKKALGLYFDALYIDDDRYKIIEGVLNLSEYYMEKFDFKKSKYLYKKAAAFKYSKFKARIDGLKKKEKELKQQAKKKK
jgi:hypothetical protein